MTLGSFDMTPILAFGSMRCGVIALQSLLTLHFVSPEFQPSWRMVSEYALDQYRWLITAFFIFWGARSMLLAVLLRPLVDSAWARVGVDFLAVSGVGGRSSPR
jgi:hypothetical protein